MVEDLKVKVCGVTRKEDARAAADAGADFLGINFYTNSPRAVAWEAFPALRAGMPSLPLVYVQVTPSLEELRRARDAGFACYQIHVPEDYSLEEVAAWSETVGTENLWLAPKRPPGKRFPEELFPFADTFLVDTFKMNGFGGSGETGDWEGFHRLLDRFPEKKWILAGGLSPENIGDALSRSGARIVDVNSGVESLPGVKDTEKIRRLFAELSAT